jgi:MFS family permease
VTLLPSVPVASGARPDRFFILAASGLRSVAIGGLSVIFGLYLAASGLSEIWIGAVIAAGLAGMAVGTLVVAHSADRWGRRKSLLVLSVLMAACGIVLALASDHWLIAASAFVGMINGMGRDRGPLQAIDQSALAQLSPAEQRTAVFALYTLVTDLGTAGGSLLAALPASLDEYRVSLLVYASILVVSLDGYRRTGTDIESASASTNGPRLSERSRRLVLRFAALSTMDSLGGGFITRSLLTYWFVQRFDVDVFWMGPLFAAASVVNSVAYFAAAWLARRIGLIHTMVFTHIPSSVLLMLVPLAPNFPVAVVLFLFREFLAPMDVPTRQSYLTAIVGDHERTAATGLVNVARNASWAVGPLLAGAGMAVALSSPLYAAGAVKILYDLMLWRSFRRIRPPEETQ